MTTETDTDATIAVAPGPEAAPASDAPSAAGPSSSPGAEPPASPQGQPRAADEPAAPKSALEAVLQAEAKRREAEEAKANPPAPVAAEAPKADPAAPADPEAGDDAARIPDEVFKALPPVVKNRFAFLTRQNNDRRDKLKAVEPIVQRDRQLQGFLEQHGIQTGEFQWLMQGSALVKTDPARAMAHFKPLFDELLAHVGEVLPQDLAAEVEAGTISQARAKELAAARNAKHVADANAQRVVEQHTTAEAQAAQAQAIHEIGVAITGWENQWKGSDPDFAAKQPFVWPEMQALITSETQRLGRALTKAETLACANAARKNVEQKVSAFRPAPKAKNTVTGGAAAMTTKEPKNALEAAQMGLARARQAA